MKQFLKTLGLGILAGLCISLGGFLNILCLTYLPSPIGKILGSLVFPIGLMIICFCRLNLYTGKIGYALDKNNKVSIYELCTMLIGNIIATIIIGKILKYFCIDEFNDSISAIIQQKSNMSIMHALDSSMLCGLLVYVAVYMFKTAKNNLLKIVGIEIPIALFVFAGYDHCIANSFYLTFGSGWNVSNTITFITIVIGNSIGSIITNKITS